MNHSSSEKRLSKKSEGVAGTGTENVAAPGSLASVHNVYADAWIANKVRVPCAFNIFTMGCLEQSTNPSIE